MDLKELPASRGYVVRLAGRNIKAEEIVKLFPPLVSFIVTLDGALLKNKNALLSALASAFQFPSYFGHNWDALLDCMRSLPDFLPAESYVLIIENSSALLENSAENNAFRDVAEEAGAFLEEKYKRRLKVVML